jgi:hypothetical protein
MGVDGHGPRWQDVVIEIMPQHTSPAGHPAELTHWIPDVPPLPLLALPPNIVPPLLALPPSIVPPLVLLPPLCPPPLLLAPLVATGATPPASSATLDASPGPGTVSSLPPHAAASTVRPMTHDVGPRRTPIFDISSRSSKDDSGH